jgi:hypothetical protein
MRLVATQMDDIEIADIAVIIVTYNVVVVDAESRDRTDDTRSRARGGGESRRRAGAF